MTRQIFRLAILAAGLLLVPRAVQAQVSTTGAAGAPGSVTISRPDYDRLVDLGQSAAASCGGPTDCGAR